MKKKHYEYLRVLSMIGIVGVHCTAAFVNADMDRSTIAWWYGSFLQHIVRIALPLFFMLSGALALDRDYPSLSEYYKKRVLRILVPFFIYSWVYVLLSFDFSSHSLWTLIPYYVKQLVGGNVSYHLWFVYSIMGLYLCTPFLAKMLQSLSTKHLTVLVGMMLAVLGLQLYPPFIGIHVEVSDFIFSGWVIYYILGYYLSRPEVKKRLPMWPFAIGFFAALLATEIIWWWYPQYANNMYDLSYTMILMASAVFLWFEKYADRLASLPDKLYKVVSWLSSYSYSVYLIHAAVLSELVGTRMGITIYWSNYIISSTVRILLVFVISLAVSVVIDNLIVKPLQTLLQKALPS